MADLATAPNPDLVYSLYTGGFKPQFVRIALLLDVFTPLVDGPADARTVAQACGCDVAGTRALLEYLWCLQVLERHENTYALTPTAEAFLLPGRESYAGDWMLMQTGTDFWEGVLEALRGGRPADPNIPWAQDAWLESHRSARREESLEMWRAAGVEPGQRPGLRILDVACGCAVKSLVLAQVDPTVRVTCVDSPEVLDVARDLAERLQVLPQVMLLAGDIHVLDLGTERYDVALLGQITYYLRPQQNIDLFERVCRSLVHGGMLVIDAAMASEAPDETSSLATLFTRAVSGGAAHAFSDYGDWLQQAGFRDTVRLGEHWLSASK